MCSPVPVPSLRLSFSSTGAGLGGLYSGLYNQLNLFLVFCNGDNASCKSEDTKCSSSDQPGWEKEKLVSEWKINLLYSALPSHLESRLSSSLCCCHHPCSKTDVQGNPGSHCGQHEVFDFGEKREFPLVILSYL